MTERQAFFIDRLAINNLWGFRNIRLSFYQDVNVIIGPNGSGKTTILNILRWVLTGNLAQLIESDCDSVEVHLREFDGKKRKRIAFVKGEDSVQLNISGNRFEFPITWLSRLGDPRYRLRTIRQGHGPTRSYEELQEVLSGLVPTAWLPVSRRLPLSAEDEEELIGRPYGQRRPHLESVDERFESLIGELVKYRLSLNSQLDKKYKEFERNVLQLILYSPEDDSFSSFVFPSDEDQKRLERTFSEAGFLDPQMKRRIAQHFDVARKVEIATRKGGVADPEADLPPVYMVIPLIKRTRKMVDLALELERQKEIIFSALVQYKGILNSFWSNKTFEIEGRGGVRIESLPTKTAISPLKLSSGEKQIFILLTQALLNSENPVVYVADEPELSLHVRWQSRLLKALQDLGGKIQIIVATHSPDMIGPYMNRVISLD